MRRANAAAFQTRDAFHRQILLGFRHPALSCCATSTVQTATSTPVWPPRAWLPTCFHAQCCALDPGAIPAFTGSPRATSRPSISATETTHEHTKRTSKPRDVTGGKPPRCGQRFSLRSCTDQVFSAQGLLYSRKIATAADSDRSPRRLYPDLIDLDTSCRSLMLLSVWNHDRVVPPCGNGVAEANVATRRPTLAHGLS